MEPGFAAFFLLTDCTRYCTMVSMNDLIAISDVRANLPELVNKVYNNMDRVVITINGQPKAVLMSEEELESLEETAEILAIPGARETLKKSKKQFEQGKMRLFEDILRNAK